MVASRKSAFASVIYWEYSLPSISLVRSALLDDTASASANDVASFEWISAKFGPYAAA